MARRGRGRSGRTHAERQCREPWWKAADPVFAPRYLYLGEPDETIERLNKVRGVAGFVIILAAAIHYRGARGVPATFEDWANSLITIALAGFIAVIVVGAALVATTVPGRRGAAAWQLRWPFVTFAGLVGLFLFVFGPIQLAHAQHWVKPGTSWVAGVLIIFYIPVLLGGTVCLCRALYLCAVGFCRAADGHPLLPPLVAPLATAVWAIRSIFFSPDDSGMPADLHLILVVCGPLSIALLSYLEIARLRRSPYFPFLDGPPRLSTAAPPAHRGGMTPQSGRT
jgi:hypothetical protein